MEGVSAVSEDSFLYFYNAMVEAYWNIGKSIVEQQGGEARAEYGAELIQALSLQMTADFGKGFTVTNLRKNIYAISTNS